MCLVGLLHIYFKVNSFTDINLRGVNISDISCPTYYLDHSPVLVTLGVWYVDIPEVNQPPTLATNHAGYSVASGMTSVLRTLRGSDEDARLSFVSAVDTLPAHEVHGCHSLGYAAGLFVCLLIVNISPSLNEKPLNMLHFYNASYRLLSLPWWHLGRFHKFVQF